MEPEQRNRTRDTVLTLSLTLVVGAGIVFFLDLISFGLFGFVLLAVGAFAIVGFLHYALWGYAMSQATAGEREEMLAREEMADDVERVTRHSVRDLSRQRRPE